MPALAQSSRRPYLFRTPAISLRLALAMCLMAAWPGQTRASIARNVHWAASPLQTAEGQPLPPAVSYEVWLVEDGGPATLVATVSDTTWTLEAQPGSEYTVRVRGVSAQGQKSAFSPWSDPWRAATAPAGGPDDRRLLTRAQPNPFNARTAIVYTVPPSLPTGASLSLQVFDVRGRHVRALEVDRSAGAHEAIWDGTDDAGRSVPAGVYLAHYVCGVEQAAVRLTLVS